nr:hypothetical protein [Azospirillum argentinense]
MIDDVSVQAVDVGMVLRVLEPMWTTKTETATRVRGRIVTILDRATARWYHQGENPARWRGHLENLLPKHRTVQRVEHRPTLLAEIGTVMEDWAIACCEGMQPSSPS